MERDISDLTDDEVLHEYLNDIQGNEVYEPKFEELKRELLNDENQLDLARERYNSRREQAQHRKWILTTVMAAFIQGGILNKNTQWEFETARPLQRELNQTVDLLVGKRPTGSVLLVVHVPLREQPKTTIKDADEIAGEIYEKIPTLEDEISMPVESSEVETAIVVEEARDRTTADAIEDFEAENSTNAPLYLWKLSSGGEVVEDAEDLLNNAGDVNQESEIVQHFSIYTDIKDSSGRKRNHSDNLGKALEEGVEVSRSERPVPDFFIRSHHSILLEHSVMKIGKKRSEEEIPNTHFSRDELINYFSNTLSITNPRPVASNMVAKCIRRWEYMDIITKVPLGKDQINDGSQSYRFRSKFERPKRILLEGIDIYGDYVDSSIELQVKIEAMREVLQDVYDEVGPQSPLDRFA